MCNFELRQRAQHICLTFVQRRPNVFDVGPTLYKCYTNALCMLGIYLDDFNYISINTDNISGNLKNMSFSDKLAKFSV